MTLWILLVAGCMTLLAALILYLAAPQQLLVRTSWSTAKLGPAGLFFIILSQLLLQQVFGAATAVFVHVVVLMLLWSTVPLAIGYLRRFYPLSTEVKE